MPGGHPNAEVVNKLSEAKGAVAVAVYFAHKIGELGHWPPCVGEQLRGAWEFWEFEISRRARESMGAWPCSAPHASSLCVPTLQALPQTTRQTSPNP